jgi:hypothetical protein
VSSWSVMPSPDRAGHQTLPRKGGVAAGDSFYNDSA